MLYEIRVRPNCAWKSCNVLNVNCCSYTLSTILTALIYRLWLLSGTFFRCGKRKCNKRQSQSQCTKMNVIHSVIHAVVRSFAHLFILLDSPCPVLAHFVHAIKPGLHLQLLVGLGLELELSPPVREMVKLITIYIVYRPILRLLTYLLYPFSSSKLISCSLIAFLNISQVPS